MPLFALKSEAKTCSLENADADCKASIRVEQFRLGREAIYFPGFPGTRYIPFKGMTRVLCKNTAISLTGSCGKQLPMVLVRTYFDGEFYHDFLFEKQKSADRMLDAIRSCCPELPIDVNSAPYF